MTSKGSIDWTRVRQLVEAAGSERASDARAVLEERARRLSEVPEPARRSEMLEVTSFTRGDERYAIESRYVREVVRFVHHSRVPGCPDYVLGVVNVRGEIVMLVDLRRFFEPRSEAPAASSRIVVCGIDEAEIAIAVDAVDEVAEIDPSTLQAPSANLFANAATLIRGVTAMGVVFIDGAALFDDPRLFIEVSNSQ